MAFSKTGMAVLIGAALFAAGCSSTRFSRDPEPEPLQAAPAGQVSGNSLPPPAQPQKTDPAQFPAAPGAGTTTDVAAATPPPDQAAAGAPDLTVGSVAGVWNASVSGQSCKVATPQTKFGAGYRAGPLRCPAPIDGVKSWNISGSQLTLYDEGGSAVATLHSAGAEKFNGQTSTGLPISLGR